VLLPVLPDGDRLKPTHGGWSGKRGERVGWGSFERKTRVRLLFGPVMYSLDFTVREVPGHICSLG